MQHIETIELGSSQSSITFSSIPQDGTDLVLMLNARAATTGGDAYPVTQINSLTTGYTEVSLFGENGSAGSGTFTTNDAFLFYKTVPSGDSTNNTFSNIKITFSNYTSNSAKSISFDGVSENNNSVNAHQAISASSITTTEPITSLFLKLFIDNVGLVNFAQHSIASLYKITAGGDGTVTTS